MAPRSLRRAEAARSARSPSTFTVAGAVAAAPRADPDASRGSPNKGTKHRLTSGGAAARSGETHGRTTNVPGARRSRRRQWHRSAFAAFAFIEFAFIVRNENGAAHSHWKRDRESG